MKKRLLVLTLATVLVLSVAGCKKDSKEKTSDSEVTTTNYFDGIQVFEGDETTSAAVDNQEATTGGSSIEFSTDENGENVIIVDMGEDETKDSGDIIEESTSNKKGDKNNKNNKDNKDNNDNKKPNKDENIDIDDVIEEGTSESGESSGNNQGENVSEEYPGQNEGWSPIVRPEDLNN